MAAMHDVSSNSAGYTMSAARERSAYKSGLDRCPTGSAPGVPRTASSIRKQKASISEPAGSWKER